MAPTLLGYLISTYHLDRRLAQRCLRMDNPDKLGKTVLRMLKNLFGWCAGRIMPGLKGVWRSPGLGPFFQSCLRILKLVGIGLAITLAVPLTIYILFKVISWAVKKRRQIKEDAVYKKAHTRSIRGFGSMNLRTNVPSIYTRRHDLVSPPYGTFSGDYPRQRLSSAIPQEISSGNKLRLQFEAWYARTEEILKNKAQMTNFPWPQAPPCGNNGCTQAGLAEPCQHALGAFLRASPQFSKEWLQRERRRWHPDKFCLPVPEFIQKDAANMFKLIGEIQDSEGIA